MCTLEVHVLPQMCTTDVHHRCVHERYIQRFFFLIFQLTFLHPPVRATVGEVRYSIEIDVGGE